MKKIATLIFIAPILISGCSVFQTESDKEQQANYRNVSTYTSEYSSNYPTYGFNSSLLHKQDYEQNYTRPARVISVNNSVTTKVLGIGMGAGESDSGINSISRAQNETLQSITVRIDDNFQDLIIVQPIDSNLNFQPGHRVKVIGQGSFTRVTY